MEQNKNYELTDEPINYHGLTLYRIRATQNIIFNDQRLNIVEGALGGFVQSEKNLAQDCPCWIHNNAMAYEQARVQDGGLLYNNAKAFGRAIVMGSMEDDSMAFDDAIIQSNGCLVNHGMAFGHAIVDGVQFYATNGTSTCETDPSCYEIKPITINGVSPVDVDPYAKTPPTIDELRVQAEKMIMSFIDDQCSDDDNSYDSTYGWS